MRGVDRHEGASAGQHRVLMTLWQLLLHLFSFVLPALVMATFMPLAGLWVMGPAAQPVRRRMAVHAVGGVLVLAGGLWLHGQDGKMSTYIALVLVAATLEWLLHRGWARQ